MHRELTSFLHIESYSAFLFAGFLFGHLLARWHARCQGIEPRHIDNLTLLIAVSSLFGARIFSWVFYQKPGTTVLEIFKLWGGGGLVFYGGMLGGAACVVIYALATRRSFGKLADVYAPSLALGLAFGRIGCFMAGCCWGDVCAPDAVADLSPASHHQIATIDWLSPARFPLAVTFPPDTGAYQQHRKLGLIAEAAPRSLPVHPAQLYEAILVFILCTWLHRALGRVHLPGEILARFAMGYGAIRFGVEFLRADNPPHYSGMTLSQVISLLVGLLGLAFLVQNWRKRARPLPTVVPAPEKIHPPGIEA